MNEETQETQVSTWAEEHPCLPQMTFAVDEDSVDELIRYTLDELRFA